VEVHDLLVKDWHKKFFDECSVDELVLKRNNAVKLSKITMFLLMIEFLLVCTVYFITGFIGFTVLASTGLILLMIVFVDLRHYALMLTRILWKVKHKP